MAFVFLSSAFWRRQLQPAPVLLPGKSHGRKSLVGCSPWGRKESDTTEWFHFHFSLSCIGEGNGNPLQCSCLENPRDGGAWWAAISGVAQSDTTALIKQHLLYWIFSFYFLSHISDWYFSLFAVIINICIHWLVYSIDILRWATMCRILGKVQRNRRTQCYSLNPIWG